MQNINHSLRDYHIIRPGTAILSPANGSYGTMGFLGTSDGQDRWIVSCYHVLGPPDSSPFPAGAREPVFYATDIARDDPLAYMTDAKFDATTDCAAALILPGRSAWGPPLGIGPLGPIDQAVVGQFVLKSGGATGVTEGYVNRVSADEIEVVVLGLSPGYQLSEPGDSGALWVDATTRSPVAMHHRGSTSAPKTALAVPIDKVLKSLGLQIAT